MPTPFTMRCLFLDFETRSRVDLRAAGAYRYAEDPTTKVLCCAWAVDNEPVRLWVEGETVPGWAMGVPIPDDVKLVAHNAEFEREILRHVLKITLPIDRFIDTATLSARMSLPRKLEDLAHFFALDSAAKEEGKAAIDALCRPRKATKSSSDEWWTPATKPEAFAKLYARCKQDVELTRAIFGKLLPLESSERAVWEATIAMNERGVKVDLASIPPAREVLAREAGPMSEEFERLTSCKVKSYKRVAAALGLPDVRKPTVRRALRDPATSPAVKRALTIYQALSKSSVAKLDAMEERVNKDGRVRGSFIYCGAERTARWSSGGVQFQNFARGLGKETLIAFEALHAGILEPLFEGFPRPHPEPSLTPTSTISNMLRGFILGPFIVGDLAQIEARGLNWLADEAKMLETFRNKGDPYKQLASVIYNVPVEKVTKDQRFMGKQGVLGCGYGLGYKGFIRMLDEIYDVEISEDESKRVVNAYRESSPNVVKLWDRLGKGFVFVVAKKTERVRVTRNIYMGMITVGGVPYAYMELPSGRRLYYARPELDSTPRGPCVRYFGRDIHQGGAWTMIRTYGGKLAENATQAVSRDIIAASLVRLTDRGFPLVMTVHDETVSEGGDPKEFKEIMETAPKWAEGLPLEVDVFESPRYRK